MDAFAYQSKQISDDQIDELRELVERRARQVLEFAHDLEKALNLRGRSERNPQVAPELEGRAQRVSFHDVRFYRKSGTPQLVKHGPGARMVTAIGYAEHVNRQTVSALPRHE